MVFVVTDSNYFPHPAWSHFGGLAPAMAAGHRDTIVRLAELAAEGIR